jgi:hypothetical protein
MENSMVSKEVQEMLDRMSDRMVELMSADPDWREEASQIEDMLDSSDIFVLPEGTTPRAWCESLFQTPRLSDLARRMIAFGMKPEDFDRPLDVIVNVLPSAPGK